jgi:hypothetical protein
LDQSLEVAAHKSQVNKSETVLQPWSETSPWDREMAIYAEVFSIEALVHAG